MKLFPEQYGLTLVDAARRAVEKTPYRPVCRQGTVTCSLIESYTQAKRIASALISNGLQPGERVGVLMPGHQEFLTAVVAVALAGGVTEFLLPQYGSAELPRMLRSAPPGWLLYSASHQDEAAAIVTEFAPKSVVLEDETEAAFHWSEFVAQGASDVSDMPVTPDSDAFILFTSGTTGTPKAIRRSHNSIMSQAVLYNNYMDLTNQSISGSMQFSYEAIPAILADGGCFVLADMLRPREWLATIERERISHTGGVASLLQLWLSYPNISEFDLSSLQCIAVGSMTVSPDLHAQVLERIGIPLMQVYGSVEAGLLTVNTTTEGPRLASLGLPVEGKTLRIIDQRGEAVPTGDIGELVVRAAGEFEFGLMRGYCDATATPWQDGWLHTGDLVYQDKAGYLYLVGRTYETINVAGHKIYAPEVEQVLRNHPAVAEAAVIGLPDSERDEIVVAYVVPQPQKSITIKELRGHCSRYLAPHKLPKRILVWETLPRTATGKVDKQALKDQS